MTGRKFNVTDVEETVAGVKRQHNILEQLGIDVEDAYGYKVIETVIQLRKTGVRKIGKTLGCRKRYTTGRLFRDLL